MYYTSLNQSLNIAGLYVLSTESAQIPWFDSVFADIGDEQSLSQSLSTFSGHLKQISVSKISRLWLFSLYLRISFSVNYVTLFYGWCFLAGHTITVYQSVTCATGWGICKTGHRNSDCWALKLGQEKD